MTGQTDLKSQVLAATNLVELVGRSVALKHRGKNYLGLCPFHSEKTPSFNVDPTRQYFKCFGCGAKGNAIDFVMQRDRVEFMDAMRQLAEAAGIEIQRFGQTKEKLGQRQMLLDACSAATGFFQKMLADPLNGLPGREYLEQRGFSAESIQKFQLGLAVESWDALLKSGIARKHAPPLLAAAGLIKPRERGEGFYDTFRNRLMFPIRDETGRVIAFGGRVMPGSADPAKYLNSPETPLFSKSRSVFGLDLAKQKIVETRTVAVVEGYTDVVMAHQFGASNVVSILGTAMTESHVSVLRRFADRIVLLFDADAAGDKAVDRAVELFLTQPIEIAIATLPEGVDPDEFLLQQGLPAFEQVLAGAADALTYKWKQLVRQFNAEGGDLTGQQAAVQQYMQVLAGAKGSGPVDALRWGSALTRVSRLTEIPVAELNQRFRSIKPTRPADASIPPAAGTPRSVAPPRRRGPMGARQRAERWILSILLAEPGRWLDLQREVTLDDFSEPLHRQLAEVYWRHQQDEGEPVFNEFLGSLAEPELADLATELVEEFDQLQDPNVALADALLLFGKRRDQQETDKQVAALRHSEQPLSDTQERDFLKALAQKAHRPGIRWRVE